MTWPLAVAALYAGGVAILAPATIRKWWRTEKPYPLGAAFGFLIAWPLILGVALLCVDGPTIRAAIKGVRGAK